MITASEIHTSADSKASLGAFADFATMRQIFIERALVAFQVVLLIFTGALLLLFLLPNLSTSLLGVAVIACFIDIGTLWYLQRTLLHKNAVLTAQIGIIVTLIVGCVVGACTFSSTLILAAIIAMVTASLSLNSLRFTIFIGIFSILLYALALLVIPNINTAKDIFLNLPTPFGELMNILLVALCFGVVLVFIVLLSSQLRQSLGQMQALADSSEQMRLVELQNNEALNIQFQEQKRLLEIVASLEVPIMPLVDGIIVVPLVGALDTGRMQTIQERVLEVVNTRRSTLVIVEMTGVPIIDTHTANQLVHLAQAVRLLGTQTALTGMQPEIASALVRIGTDLSEIRSYASIQSVLEDYMQQQSHISL